MNKLPHILVLNLLRNVEKKELLKQQFEKLSINNYVFFPALDANYISNDIAVKIGAGYGFGRLLSKTEIAILMSHINMLSYAKTTGIENIIILEDDVILCEDFINRVTSILNKLPENWEYVYLSGHSDYVKLPIVENEQIISSPQMIGAFSYMTNIRAYQKIINFCLSFMTTYDDLIMQMVMLKKLNSYTVLPFLSYIRDYYSENGNSITKNHPSKIYFKNRLQ